MVFGRGKKAKKQESAEPEDVQDDATPAAAGNAADDRRANGPFDVSEISSRDGPGDSRLLQAVESLIADKRARLDDEES